MTAGLDKARAALACGKTLVLVKGDGVIGFTERGVRPLLELLDGGTILAEYSVADRVVGAGAAHLYRILGLRAIYAEVISEEALSVLSSDVTVEYGTLVPYIKNRRGDGRCPIEECVSGVTDSHAALTLIRKRLAELEGAK